MFWYAPITSELAATVIFPLDAPSVPVPGDATTCPVGVPSVDADVAIPLCSIIPIRRYGTDAPKVTVTVQAPPVIFSAWNWAMPWEFVASKIRAPSRVYVLPKLSATDGSAFE